MSPRLKKLIGLFLMVFWLIAYAIFITGLAVRLLPGADWYVELIFYVITGFAWVLPMMPMIWWMNRGSGEAEP